jgi:RNA polymerase sigma factor (sigma-70 family)
MGGRPLEDSELVERARRGDVEAYEELVRKYQDLAMRTAYVIAGADDAPDAVQEAFVKAYRFVANEAINRRRAGRRQATLAVRAAEGRPTGDAVPSPERAALEHEQQRLLVRAMNDLREEDRLVIAYRYWFDLSEAEMAEALGCPRGTVKSRLSRSLVRLRKRLEATGSWTGEAMDWSEALDD